MLALGLKPTDVMRYSDKIGKRVHRNQVSQAIKPDSSLSDGVYDRIELVLDRFEDEVGAATPEAVKSPNEGLVEFRLSGNFGVDVVVSGPVSDLAELEAAVGRLLSQMGDTPPKG